LAFEIAVAAAFDFPPLPVPSIAALAGSAEGEKRRAPIRSFIANRRGRWGAVFLVTFWRYRQNSDPASKRGKNLS
jgi:hypothetical protein